MRLLRLFDSREDTAGDTLSAIIQAVTELSITPILAFAANSIASNPQQILKCFFFLQNQRFRDAPSHPERVMLWYIRTVALTPTQYTLNLLPRVQLKIAFKL